MCQLFLPCDCGGKLHIATTRNNFNAHRIDLSVMRRKRPRPRFGRDAPWSLAPNIRCLQMLGGDLQEARAPYAIREQPGEHRTKMRCASTLPLRGASMSPANQPTVPDRQEWLGRRAPGQHKLFGSWLQSFL